LLSIAQNPVDDRPVLTSEYAHAMGNAMGNFKEYWDEIYSNKRMLGGFIWDWVDQGFYKTDEHGTRFMAYGGDFGDKPNLKAFCFNGVVFGEREVTPKYFEVKKVYQPMMVETYFIDDTNASIYIQNRNHFINLSEYETRWYLIAGADTIQKGIIEDIDLPAGETKLYKIPFKKFNLKNLYSCSLRISFHLKEDKLWAKKGHEIGFEQFEIKRDILDLGLNPKIRPFEKINHENNKIEIQGKDFSAVFDLNTGSLTSLQNKGKEIIVSPLVFQGYRAPLDNDKGFGNWLAKDWKNHGLDSLKREVTDVKFSQNNNQLFVRVMAESHAKKGKIIHQANWIIDGNGKIKVSNIFTPEGELPELPRLGVVMSLNSDFEQMQWYGHGPYENYSDRKESCPVGIYTSTVTDQYVPYPHPQETGNKEDIRWITLKDKNGKGIRIQCTGEKMSGSALHFTAGDLDKATHAYMLTPREEVVLSLDAIMLGLGNSSCGPGVLKKYAIEKTEYQLEFEIDLIK